MKTHSLLDRSPFAALLLAALSLGVSCGGGSGTGAGAPVEFSGAWEGTWGSVDPASGAAASVTQTGSLSLQLEQEGAVLRGTAQFHGHPCLTVCDVLCQVRGGQVSGDFRAGPVRMTMRGSEPDHGQPQHGHGPHHAGSFAGTYQILDGPCAGELGTLDLTPVVGMGAEASGPEGGSVDELVLIVSEEGDLIRMTLLRGATAAPIRQQR